MSQMRIKNEDDTAQSVKQKSHKVSNGEPQMKPLYDFIVHISKLFDDEMKIGDTIIKKDMRWDDFESRVPYGEIVAVPEKYKTEANVGDTLVVHHHISQQPDKFRIGNNQYLVSYSPTDYQGQAYAAIDKDTGAVKMIGDWIFLKAVSQKQEENVTSSGIFLGHVTKEEKHEAEVYCEGAGTEELGIKKGDVVGYTKNSDYRIKLPNGDEVYRCKPNDLVYVKTS